MKTEICHDAYFVPIGGIAGCHAKKHLQFRQW